MTVAPNLTGKPKTASASKVENNLLAKKNISFLAKKAINLLPEFSLKIAHSKYLENLYFRPRYEAYIRENLSNLPSLHEDMDGLILRSLKQDGVFITSLEKLQLKNTNSFLEVGSRLMGELQDSSFRLKEKKIRVSNLFSEYSHFVKYPEIFRWGLQDRLLKIAENYIQTPVGYNTFSCDLTNPCASETNQRRWHVDHEDRRMLKVIVYLNDVDIESGPFEYLNLEATKFIYEKLSFREKHGFLTHDQLLSRLAECSSCEINACLGKAGTVIFVDTARLFHRGKPTTKKSRQAAFFGYISRRPSNPFRCGTNGMLSEQLQELAKDLPQDKRDCVLWRNALPPVAQLVPKYYYDVDWG